MFDDDDDETTGGLGGLNGRPSLMEEITRAQQESAALDKRLAEQRQQMFERAAAELQRRRYGPSDAEQMFAISAALASPTRYKGFGGVMENLMPVLAQTTGARRQGEAEKQDALLALQQKYLEGDMAAQRDALRSRLGLLGIQEKASRPAKRRTGFNPITGELQDMDTAEKIGLAPPTIGEVRDGYRFKGGDPASESSWEKAGGPTQPASGGFQ